MFFLTTRQLTLWSFLSLNLNMALMIYLPYTFFFDKALLEATDAGMVVATLLILLQLMEVMVNITHSTTETKENTQWSRKNYMRVGILLDVVSILAIMTLFIPQSRLSALRLLIYAKIPSVNYNDHRISVMISSSLGQLFYVLVKITFVYLTFCNLSAGAFYKLDFGIYLQQGYYYENLDVWLLDAVSMPDILSWSSAVHYLYSMYWSIITACSIGYGDITPLNPPEVLLVMIIFVPNILFYGFLIDNLNITFSKLGERHQAIIQSQLAILRSLREANVGIKTRRLFKFYLRKAVDTEINKDALIMSSLSHTLKMEINYHLFSKPLKKFKDLNVEDTYVLCENIREYIYEKGQVIIPESVYFYVIEGEGDIVLRGVDICCCEMGATVISRYEAGCTLNIHNFLTRHSNPFVCYRTQSSTKVYQISEWPNIQSLRLKFVGIAIHNQYSDFGLECYICNSSSHVTNQCHHFSFTRHHIKSRVPSNTNSSESEIINHRELHVRNQRENLIVRDSQPFRLGRFEETAIIHQLIPV